MSIIGSVVWNPQKPTPGQSVKVDVCGPDGKPYANQQTEYVGINGVAGSTQYLQFPFAGDQKVTVTAVASDGTHEQKVVTVPVAAKPASLTVQAITSNPANRDITATQIAWLNATTDINILTVAPRPPYDSPYDVVFRLLPLSKFVPSTAATPKAALALAAKPGTTAGTAAAAPTSAPAPRIAATPAPDNIYTWDFGDGSAKVTTDSPSVTHDFKPALSTTHEYHQFHVTVTASRKAAAAASSSGKPAPTNDPSLGSWTRTLSVHNTYVACKKRGYVVLNVTVGEWAKKSGNNFVGKAEIKNNEPEPITLVSRVLVPVLADSDKSTTPSTLEAVDPPIVVPAKGSVSVGVSVPFSKVPADAIGFSVTYSEQPVPAKTSDAHKEAARPHVGAPKTDAKPHAKTSPIAGAKIRATAHFLVEPFRSTAAAPAASSAAKRVAADKRVHDKGGPPADPVPQNEVMPPVAVGNQCDPDNLPNGVPADLACQITPKTHMVGVSARFLNARKGDVVLCPSVGSASLVDGIFAQLNPEQLYGHTGIMTRNYEQITHCTASQDRMQQYTVGGVLADNDEGLDPDSVKYGWPGVLTQTVDHAVNGEYYTDPASGTGQEYQFQSFNGTSSAIYVGTQFVIIPPVVVKPDPLLETSALRDLLAKVADDAYSNTGKFHYRFYAFTNPAANLTAPSTGLDANAAWAEGTRGAVCSSFVWMMMKGRGVHALGASARATASELDSHAKQLGVQLDPNGGSPDGLFYYSEAQRSVCGNWLWNQIYNLAAGQAGWFGEWITGAGHYYADQVCNTFAADDNATPVEAPGISQPWQTPGNSNAISPSNFLAWNGPEKGGVLGYSEPLIYMPNSVATVPTYKWSKVKDFGKLTGLVTLDGKPVEHVTVQIPGMTAGTDKDGRYTFDKVPYGPYLVKAQHAVTMGPRVDGVKTGQIGYAVGKVSVKVEKTAVTAPTIKLQKPNDPFNRSVAITGHLSLDCSEWPDHYTSWLLLAGKVDVGLGYTHGTWSQDETSKDATVNFSATLDYNSDDDSVDIVFTAALDQPGGNSLTYTCNIAPGKSHTFVIGDKNSWLNGTGPNKWTYDGFPDLEAKNDTMCSSITFTNNEWSS